MQWIELTSDEEKNVWKYVCKDLNFHPSISPRFISLHTPSSFRLPEPYAVYDMRELISAYELSNDPIYDQFIIQLLESLIMNCMGTDDFVYALDWQHRCFKYFPMEASVPEDKKTFHPGYLPDGDYYFYLSQNFSWGYLTHPWQQGLYVYGEVMLSSLSEISDKLGLSLVFSSSEKDRLK